LNEEDAALVLQRFYRKWKVNQLKPEDAEPEAQPTVVEQTWDAPFRVVENHMRDIRAGVKRREKVDLKAYRKELIMAGLESQDLKNQEREKVAAGKWHNVISSSVPVQNQVQVGRGNTDDKVSPRPTGN